MCPKGQAGTKGMQIMEDAVFDKIVKELEGYCDWIEMICLNSDGEPLLDKKIALMENEKHPLDDFKNDEITK